IRASPTSRFHARSSKAVRISARRIIAGATGRRRVTPNRSTPRPAISASAASNGKGPARSARSQGKGRRENPASSREEGAMLRWLMIVSGSFEALFGLFALLATVALVAGLGVGADASAVFLARILGAATLGLGVAAILARNELASAGGVAAAYGLALYNVIAACLILWTTATTGLGGTALWGAGLVHAVFAVLFVYAL